MRAKASERPRAVIWCLRRCVCVLDSPGLRTQLAVRTVKFMKSYATWQHWFYVCLNFLSYPASLSDQIRYLGYLSTVNKQ